MIFIGLYLGIGIVFSLLLAFTANHPDCIKYSQSTGELKYLIYLGLIFLWFFLLVGIGFTSFFEWVENVGERYFNKKKQKCTSCNGTGKVTCAPAPCGDCGGSGKFIQQKEIL